jgi:hypothetical protein
VPGRTPRRARDRPDPYRRLIEERKRLDRRGDLSESERQALERSLKVVANSIGYGVFAEINRIDTAELTLTTVYGLDDSFSVSLPAVEEPGRYSFPPIAALITAAGRLQLALLERLVADLGGTYVLLRHRLDGDHRRPGGRLDPL